MGLRIDSSLDFQNEGTPATPASGWTSLYTKSDSGLYLKSSSGVEIALPGSGNTAARAYRSAALTCTANAFTLMPCDTKSFDLGTCYSTATHLYTCPVSGCYQVNGQFNPASNPGTVMAAILKNGTVVSVGQENEAVTAYAECVLVSDVVQCAAGDTLGLAYYINSAVALSGGAGGATSNYVSIVKVN